MNERFFDLPPDKQLAIINAGLKVFADNDYKRASTDEMARLGGISKGLLFYYFRNKKVFYLFLFDYAFERIAQTVVDQGFSETSDFFERCSYAAQKKMAAMTQNPSLFDFMLRAFCSNKEEVSAELDRRFHDTMAQVYGQYFTGIDTRAFRPGVAPQEVLDMLTLMADGLIHNLQRQGQPLDPAQFMARYTRWTTLLKHMAYREEYRDD